MSNIPKARAILITKVLPHLPRSARRHFYMAVHLLKRRPQHHRAHGTRTKMNPVLALKIRAFAALHPKWTQQRIAERFNVTNARVSETLHGKSK